MGIARLINRAWIETSRPGSWWNIPPEPDIEYYLTAAYHGARVEVSGTPTIGPDDSVELIEKLTALAKKMGGRVRLAGEGLDGAPMDVSIYDGRPNGTRTHE